MTTETQTPETPAGAPAPIDVNAITQAAVKAATEAATAAVNAAISPITKQVQTLQQSLENAPTAESVSKAVTEAIGEQRAQQAKASERQKFIAENLKGIPDAYHSHIGDDPTKFAEQEQNLRKVLKGDLETLGVKADNIGGDAKPDGSSNADNAGGTGGAKPVTAAVDTSKLSGIELLGMGVQQTGGQATQPGDSAKTTNTPPIETDAAK